MKDEVRINGETYWGVTQVAEYLGVKHQNVDKQVGLPIPAVDVPRRRLWKAAEIKAFKKARDKRRAKTKAAVA